MDRVGSDPALEENPGKLRTGGFIEAQDPGAGGVWRSAAYWARKDRGIQLRNAQLLCGDGEWVQETEGEGRKFVIRRMDGSPWIAQLIGKHGNRSTYINWECRCELCIDSNSSYGWDYRQGVQVPE